MYHWSASPTLEGKGGGSAPPAAKVRGECFVLKYSNIFGLKKKFLIPLLKRFVRRVFHFFTLFGPLPDVSEDTYLIYLPPGVGCDSTTDRAWAATAPGTPS